MESLTDDDSSCPLARVKGWPRPKGTTDMSRPAAAGLGVKYAMTGNKSMAS